MDGEPEDWVQGFSTMLPASTGHAPSTGAEKGRAGGVWGKESQMRKHFNPTPFTPPEWPFLLSFILYSGAVTLFPCLEAHAETAEKMAAK